MAKLELVKVDTDTAKIYNPKNSFVFKLTFNNQEYLNDDVEFEIIYFGDAYSDNHDQKICHNVIGPLEAGKLYFELETSPIDLTKIPIKTLFGLTTILIVGKFKGEQFIRIGFVVDVRYPGINSEKLVDSDDVAITGDVEDDEGYEDEEMAEEDSSDNDIVEDEDSEDEEVEIMDDEELDEYEEDEGYNAECDEKGSSADEELEDALAEAIMPTKKRESIPLETPIVPGKDEFEYKGFAMKQSLIELTLLDKPIIHVFDIDWGTSNKPQGDIAESSENEDNASDFKRDSEQTVKKTKTQ
ncbi:uncharacterized protein VICG_00399 [Vittaforma corneae ATCC 50505]|uniref:Anti-silencing function protein 1 n=1 Tax=Vittaforma corneae (strain ATCC 50505) TaxID=993615 RepID=L2GQR0_VITCO|nr:uncharacterized protein VICG_00399 [Vittaforma corneae ATCC 50505]ELA42647.1 hypothetical protein VICG_00399 [Vittaforma corneae ATCC 50505]